jgi:hypothetical protein
MEQVFSKDPVNIIETLTEASNQSSEIFDALAPAPPKKASPDA